MRRILHVELNDSYFDRFASSFFKSFYAYNKRWDLYVADIGLRDDQRKLLSRYGVVEQYKPGNFCRWIQIPARLASFEKIVRDGNLILHSDVDLIVLDNYEDLVEEMLAVGYDCMGAAWPEGISKYIRYRRGAAELLGVAEDSPIFSKGRIHFGFLFLRGTPAVASAICWLQRNWEQFSTYMSEEETSISGLFYARGLRVKHIPVVDCPALSFDHGRGIVPSGQPHSKFSSKPSRLVHFAICKYFMDRATSGATHEQFMAWHDVLIRPYDELPWPVPEEVCESR